MSNLKRFEYTLSLTVGAIIDMAKGSNANDIPKVNIDLHDLITENIGEGVSTLNKSLGKLGFMVVATTQSTFGKIQTRWHASR